MMNSSSPRLLRKLRLSSALASVFAYATLAPVQAQILPEVSVGGDGGATIVRNVGAGTMNVDVNGGSRIVTYDTFSLAPTTVLTFRSSSIVRARPSSMRPVVLESTWKAGRLRRTPSTLHRFADRLRPVVQSAYGSGRHASVRSGRPHPN